MASLQGLNVLLYLPVSCLHPLLLELSPAGPHPPVGKELLSHNHAHPSSCSPRSSPRFLICFPPTSMTRSNLCHAGPCPFATAWGQSCPFLSFCSFSAKGSTGSLVQGWGGGGRVRSRVVVAGVSDLKQQ